MPQTIASEEILQFLCSVFHPAAEEVRWIAEGWFSQAFSFEAGEEAYIIRLNPYEEDFQKDVFAWQNYARPGLPIPPHFTDWKVRPALSLCHLHALCWRIIKSSLRMIQSAGWLQICFVRSMSSAA